MRARIKRLVINAEAFIHIMANETAWRVSRGVPEKTKLRSVVVDPHTSNIVLFLEHPTFDEIDITNDVAPLLSTEFVKIT